MGSKPTHAFVPWKPGDTEFCRVRIQNETGSAWECGEPRSAHPGELSDFGQKLAEEQSARVAAFNARSAHPASPPEPAPESEEPQITEMRVCEIAELVLHPGQLYRFTVDPGCWKCASYGAEPARPASPPEPAPESEEPSHDPPYDASGRIIAKSGGPDPAPEPQCACLDFWTTHHPECPRVRAGLEKAGVAAPEPEPCQFVSTPHVCHDTLPPHPEPVDVAKTIVEWLDQNVSKCQHGYITVSCGECMGRYLK